MIFVVAPMVAQACRNPYQDATVVRPAPPTYPDSARELGLGVVTAKVVVTVAPDGSIVGARIVQSAGNMAVDQAALNTVRQSTYSPKIVNCQPVTGDYLFSVTFNPNASPPPGVIVPYATAPPTPPSCQMGAMMASQQFEYLQQRRDYDRAIEMAAETARMQMDCAAQLKSPERFSLEMLAGSTLSRAADLANNLGRYQQARDLVAKANAVYATVLSPSLDQNYGRFLTPNAKANVQANNDLLKRIAQQEKCSGDTTGPIRSLVLSQMPSGSTVNSVGVVQKYAVAISFGPGGYAVRSFLLIKQKAWKILTSEGGAFDLATYRRNGVPPSIATRLAASVACQS